MPSLYDLFIEYNKPYFCIRRSSVSIIQEKQYQPHFRETHCPISLEKFTKNETIIELPCQHIFSKANILKWISSISSNCPICRTQIDYLHR
jgi:hypothetical protein